MRLRIDEIATEAEGCLCDGAKRGRLIEASKPHDDVVVVDVGKRGFHSSVLTYVGEHDGARPDGVREEMMGERSVYRWYFPYLYLYPPQKT